MSETTHFDCLLVGGGLQNALIAMGLLARQPATRFALIERDRRLGGNQHGRQAAAQAASSNSRYRTA